MLKYKAWDNEYDICFTLEKYTEGDGTAVEMWCKIKGEYGYEPFAMLTVNIPLFRPSNNAQVCIDVNNLHGVTEWIEENNLGVPLGMTIPSGWCEYPVYALNLDEIKKHLK